MSTRGTGKRTLINFFSSSALQLGNYVLPMITLPIISRIIGPEKYGIINYAYAFVGYFVLFINAGFDLYGTRKIIAYNGNKTAINGLFSRILLAKTFLLCISSIAFAICIYSIPQLRADISVSLFTFLLCIGWVFNPSWFYNGVQDSRKYAMFSFTSKLLFSIAVILVIQHQKDYIYQPLLMGGAHVLISGVSLLYALRRYDIKLKLMPWERIKRTIKENKHLAVIWWLTNQSSSTNIIIAGFFLSSLSLGVFSSSLRIIIIIQTIIAMPMNIVLFPYIGEAFVSSHQDGMTRANKAFPYIFMIASGMFLATFLLAEPIILLFYGSQFHGAVSLLRISSAVLFFSTLNTAFGQQVLLNLKSEKVYLKFIISSFFLNICLLLSLSALFGVTGAAVAWALSEAIIFAGYFVYFNKHKINIPLKQYFTATYLLNNVSNLFKLNVMFYFVKKPWWLRFLYGDCVWEIEGEEKVIYLTFDDGPHPQHTYFILDQLKKYNATATFFCIGKNVSENYTEYQSIIREGHVIGNHTNSHLDGWKTEIEIYSEDVRKASEIISSPLFRPPYGHISRREIKKLAENLKLKTVMWTVMSGDFDQHTSGEKCYQNVIKNAGKGSIIVFHDNNSASRNLRYALPKVLEYFSNRGYQFRSIA